MSPPYLLLPTLYLHGKLPVTELPLPRCMFGHDALKVPVTSGDQGEKALFGTCAQRVTQLEVS